MFLTAGTHRLGAKCFRWKFFVPKGPIRRREGSFSDTPPRSGANPRRPAIPRFIVRTHALSRELPRWRTGVVLEFEGNRALVRADRADKKVFISISGSAKGRTRLLAVIRSDVDRIHSGIVGEKKSRNPKIYNGLEIRQLTA